MGEWFPNRLRGRAKGLQVCPDCGGEFVLPVDCDTVDATHTWVQLLCAQCGALREEVVIDDLLEDYDRALDASMRAIRRAADELSRDQLEQIADTLALALDRDLIGADDFARG